MKILSLVFLLFLAGSNQKNTIQELGTEIFLSLKDNDFERFRKISAIDNADIQFQIDTFMHERITKDYKKEMAERVKENFNSARKDLFEKNITWSESKFMEVDYYEIPVLKEFNFKLFRGKLKFSSGGTVHCIDLRWIAQKANGSSIILAHHPLTVLKSCDTGTQRN